MLKEGSLRVAIMKCHPNEWNPNVLPGELYKKLKKGLARTLEESGRMPPIVVRPEPKMKGYQIIDGYHRWKALQELGQDKINVYSIKVNEKTARVLTNTLNYLRGDPDRAKYTQGLVELIKMGVTQNDLAELLPENRDDISEMLDESNINIKELEMLGEDGEPANDSTDAEATDDGIWIDLKFRVSVPQAQVIEHEIGRIGDAIKGKNARGRALEFMAANSSGCPLPDDE